MIPGMFLREIPACAGRAWMMTRSTMASTQSPTRNPSQSPSRSRSVAGLRCVSLQGRCGRRSCGETLGFAVRSSAIRCLVRHTSHLHWVLVSRDASDTLCVVCVANLAFEPKKGFVLLHVAAFEDAQQFAEVRLVGSLLSCCFLFVWH